MNGMRAEGAPGGLLEMSRRFHISFSVSSVVNLSCLRRTGTPSRNRPELALISPQEPCRIVCGDREAMDGGDDEREHVLPAGDDRAPGGRNRAEGILRGGRRAEL